MADEQDKRQGTQRTEDQASPPQPGASGTDTPSRLRREIDNGTTGDKVAFDDPAAAPLGTDDEAAGTPNSAAQVRLARASEAREANQAMRDATVAPNGTAPGPVPSATTRAGMMGQAEVRRGTDDRTYSAPSSDSTAAAPRTAADLQGQPAAAKTSLWVIAAVVVAVIVALMLVF